MFSVICIVVAIYCIVIIYDPSLKELYSEISPEPKRCTTTLVERNITGTPEDQKCNWSSCEEWCLSKGASPCSKVRDGQRCSLLTLHCTGCPEKCPHVSNCRNFFKIGTRKKSRVSFEILRKSSC